MGPQLYKVTKPRQDLRFHPSTFWHSADWESSTTRPRDGYIEDKVLFAADFDEVSIHLFPRVRTVRVRAGDVEPDVLRELEPSCSPGNKAWIFCPADRRAEVDSFCPTIFSFAMAGFTRVRRGEYVSWEPQQAIACETITIAEAKERWNIQSIFSPDLTLVIDRIRSAGIYFEEQT
jgi:hypothetical protein